MLTPKNESPKNSDVYLLSLFIRPKLIHQKGMPGKHRPISYLILLALFIICSQSLPCMAGTTITDKKNTFDILILNSYHQGFTWTDDIVAAAIATTSAELNNAEFHVEYMDSKRHPGSHLYDILSKSLALKYQRRQPNIIITSDDDALNFIEEYHHKLFPKVPVIFCGVNSVKKALSVDRDYFTGLVETLDMSANIALALRLFPQTNEIVIVSDSSPTGISTRQMAMDAEQNFPDLAFSYLNGEDLSTDEMLTKLHQLHMNSTAIAPAWYIDKEGNTFDNEAIYPRISEASAVPVLGTSSANIGLGIIGGKVNSGTIQGEYAGHQALRILSGEVTIKDLPIGTKSQNRYMFDHRQLTRFAISERHLPEGAIILHRPVPFYERYKRETSIAFVAFLALFVLIAFLMWNIRRRKQVERDLVQQKHLAEQYLNIAEVILVAFDDQANITFLNRKGCEVLGYREDELLGRDWFKVCLPPEEYEPVFSAYKGLIGGEVELYKYHENYVLTKSGEKRLVAWNNVLRNDSSGGIIGLLSSGEDITDRKRMEQDLRDSEERFRTLHKASSGGIVIHDKGIILDCNQSLCDMTGYTFDELIGTNGLRLIAPDSLEEVAKKMMSEAEEPYEVEGIRKDGTTYPLYLQSKFIPYKGRTVRVAEWRDISDIRLAEEESIRLASQLRQSQKMESVGQLAGGIAHDFNNMLSAILGHSELAMMRCPPSEPVYSHLTGIQEAANRSSALVSQLLAFARKQTIAPKVLNLNAMSSSILKMISRVIGEDIDLAWSPGSDLWKIKMDTSQVDQILVNLCVNARDAITGVGKITIETRNTTFDQAYCEVHIGFVPGDFIMLAISDNGSGMSKEVQDHIFEPFYTTKELGKGTGLGLATVYGIVKQNRGFINVYSEVNEGTTFRIYLPRFIGEDVAQRTGTTTEAPEGKGETILLVEDESVILEVAQAMLKELGYVVLGVCTPGEAIKIAKNHNSAIDLLITDVIMPEMNGRDLAKSIHNIRPDLKCLFTSGYTANVIAHHGVLDEDVWFLPKPFSMKDLALKVRQTLEAK